MHTNKHMSIFRGQNHNTAEYQWHLINSFASFVWVSHLVSRITMRYLRCKYGWEKMDLRRRTWWQARKLYCEVLHNFYSPQTLWWLNQKAGDGKDT